MIVVGDDQSHPVGMMSGAVPRRIQRNGFVALIRVATVGVAGPKIVFKAAYIQHARTVNLAHRCRCRLCTKRSLPWTQAPGPKKTLAMLAGTTKACAPVDATASVPSKSQVSNGEIRRQVGRRRNDLHVATRGLHVGWIEEEDQTLNAAALLESPAHHKMN